MDHHVKFGGELVNNHTGYVLEDVPDPPAVAGCFSSAAGVIFSSAAAAIRPLTDCASIAANRHRPLPFASVQGKESSHKKIPSGGMSLVLNTAKIASTIGGASDQLKNSNDPAWAYGIIELEHPNYVFCKLCCKKLPRGVFHLKQHLTGSTLTKKGGENTVVQMCSKVNSVIKKEILDYQYECYKKRHEKENIEKEVIRRDELLDSDEVIVIETLCSGDGGHVQELEGGFWSTSGVSIGRKKANTSKGILPKFKKGKLFQSTLDKKCKKKLRDKAADQVAQWTYDFGISFDAVRYESFNKIFDSVGHVGSDLDTKPLAYKGVGVSFLEKYHEVENFVKNFKVHCETHGCSVMCNEWTDGKHLTLINFLVNCSKGTIFLKSVDISKHVKSDTMLAKMIENIILEHVGMSNVVQVITDNASKYKAVGDILMNKYPSLCWGACTTHWVDSILEDIGKLPIFSRVVKDSQRLIFFIYNNPHVLHLMRCFTQGKELARPVVTRFATNFLCLQSIHSNKDALRSMFVSDQWNHIDWSRKTEGKRIASIVAHMGFWSDILHCLRVLAPLLEVVKLIHADEKPAMGYIYHAMSKAKALIKKNFYDEPRLSMKYWKIVDAGWNGQPHQDLHATGYYLNPYLYFERGVIQMEADSQIKRHLFDVITKMCADPIQEDVIHKQLVTYRDAKGMMGLPVAIRRRSTTTPAEWWMTYGSDVKELQSFAIRVLSQTISATPCERNWSVFENQISSK